MLALLRRSLRARYPSSPPSCKPTFETLEDRALLTTAFLQTNLASDLPGVAALTDIQLKNPWGIALNPAGDFWVSNAETSTVTLYRGDVNGQAIGADSAVIKVPKRAGAEETGPSGQVYNSTSDFVVSGYLTNGPALFIFAGLDGTISAASSYYYAGGISSQATVVATTAGASYTGLALGNNGAGNFLYAANVAQGKIDVFDATFKPVKLAGSFIDPNLPANRSPFNVANINGTLFVTYENPKDESLGGLIDRFDMNGNFLGRFADGANLNAPWAVVTAPASFGTFANSLLVGNFGDGRINAYNPTSGSFLGQLLGAGGKPLAIEGLWGLAAGNGSTAGDASKIYFAAGINEEKNGLFGSLRALSPAERFIGQLYGDLLHRAPDPVGLAFWSTQLSIGVSRQQIATAIEGSDEFRSLEIQALDSQFLHRGVDSDGMSFFLRLLGSGGTLDQAASLIAGSPEYFQSRGNNAVDGFLTALYQDALGRAPDTHGKAGFTAALQAGASPVQVAGVVFASDEFRLLRVRSIYQTYLGRDADKDGLEAFVNALKQGATPEQEIAVIVASDEYFARL